MVAKSPKYVYTAPRVYKTPAALPELGAGDTLPDETQFVAYTGVGIPLKVSLLQTAAHLTGLGYTVTAPGGSPTVTITGITFTPMGSVTVGLAADTVIGVLAATVTGGALTSPVYSMDTSPYFKVVGAQVLTKVAIISSHIGDRSAVFHLAAANAATFDKPAVTIPIVAAPVDVIGTGAGGYAGLALDQGANFRHGYGAAETLSVPFEFKALNAIAVNDVLETDQAFGLGDAPDGWSFYGKRADNGAEFPMFSSLVNSTVVEGDAFQKYVNLTWKQPVAVAAGGTFPITIHTRAVAQVNTGHTTATAIVAGLDLTLEHYGIDLGADVMRSSLADIMSAPEGSPMANPAGGQHPTRNWYYIRRNENVVEIRAWGIPKRVSDNGLHCFLRDDFWITAYPGGKYAVRIMPGQPHTYTAHPAGTVGFRSDQTGIIRNVRVKRGSTVTHQWGEMNGRDAFDMAATAFDVSNNYCVLPDGALDSDMGGHGVPVVFSGSGTPSGLASVPGGVAYIYNPDGERYCAFTTNRFEASTIIPFGTAGAGTCRVMPSIGTFVIISALLLDHDGRRLWFGPGQMPKILPKHDAFYLSRRAAHVQDFPLDGLGGNMPDQTFTKHIPCTGWTFSNAEQRAGDNFRQGGSVRVEDRLGGLPYSDSNLICFPYDEATDQRTRVKAAMFACTTMVMYDERNGRFPVTINGPDNAGAAFSGMGPNNPAIALSYKNSSVGSPPHNVGKDWKNSGLFGNRGGGAGNQYEVFKDASHAPEFFKVPLLRSGDAALREHMITHALQLIGSTSYPLPVNGETLHGSVVESSRTGGWAIVRAGDADAVAPDEWAEAAVLGKVMSNTGRALKHGFMTGSSRHLGVPFNRAGPPNYMSYYAFGVTSQARRGKYPEWRAAAEGAYIFQFALADDEGNSNGIDGVANAGAYINTANDTRPSTNGDPGGTPYSSIRAMILGHWGDTFPSRSTGKFEQPGYNYTSGVNAYSTGWLWASKQFLTLRNLGLASLPAKVVRIAAQAEERMRTAPSGFNEQVLGAERLRVVVVDVPPANRLILADPIREGSISGPSPQAVINTPATFKAQSSIYPAWVALRTGGADVGSRVQVTADGNVSLTATSTADHTARLYTQATGGTLLDETDVFTPLASAPADNRGPYLFQDKTVQDGGADYHNKAAGSVQQISFFIRQGGVDGTGPTSTSTAVRLSTSATDPNATVAGMPVRDLFNYENNVYYAANFSFATPGTYRLWISFTNDGTNYFTWLDPVPVVIT